jgi:cyclohexanecarboxylate-CoA ligase
VIIAHRTDSGIHRVAYREYAQHVERFAGALYELGVRPGQVVAVQVPNWWQVNALILTCARLGAVVAPIMMTIRARELERMLARLRARWLRCRNTGVRCPHCEWSSPPARRLRMSS